MQTNLSEEFLSQPDGQQANDILRSCVHCGFCTATCPTYQLLGDELDGPRGRIYLIKQALEGQEVTRRTQLHLDRCLSCRSCETTCPSGVEYAKLLDIGRRYVDNKVKRPLAERTIRRLLGIIVPYSSRFSFMMKLGHQLRRYLPTILSRHIPSHLPKPIARDAWPEPRHARKIILLEGCAQPVMRPTINLAVANILDRLGISLVRADAAGCCGALSHHLGEQEMSHEFIHRNISTWWSLLEDGAEAIVSSSSACSAMLKDYAYLMRNDENYAEKAKAVSAAARDISEIIGKEDLSILNCQTTDAAPIALHMPCSAQHGQQLDQIIPDILHRCGFRLTPVADEHLCCGAAGTYSILQTELSETLRSNKLTALEAGQPALIATANIGCHIHLQEGTQTPVVHWAELIEQHCPS